MTRQWEQTEVFRGPVKFGYSGDSSTRDVTFYGATASALILIDTSADEIYLDGMDLWLKDDDQLEFGDVSDIVIDWDNSNSQLLILPAAANTKLAFGSATYYTQWDANVGVVDMDLYGTNPQVNINRNLTSGATNGAVVYIKQDNTSDDQAALQVAQDAAVAGVDFDCGVDIDCPTTLTTGATVDIQRNLTSGNTDNAVVYIKQDNTSDDQAALKIDQDATAALALDANGWCDIGYTEAAVSGTPATGAIRICKATDEAKFFLAVHTGSGTMKYIGITSSTTA